jgi:hypothetical protein
MWRALVVAATLGMAACAGVGDRPGAEPRTDEGAAGGTATSDHPTRYQTTAVVLESDEHGPMLCLGGILESLPPQCGDVPISNWDWEAVGGEESMAGTTWGEYRVVGTYDRTSFTVLETGPPQAQPDDDPGIGTPCPEPAGGWIAPEPERTSEADRSAAIRAAESEPDVSGVWIDYADETPTEEEVAAAEPGYVILNAAFTGDLDRHTMDLRELWGGPLCVIQHERTYEELRTIQKDLEPSADELRIQVLWSSVDVEENVVEVGVVVADPEARAAIDARYGEGSVRIHPALAPLP